MLENIPTYVTLVFLLAAAYTLFCLYKASLHSKKLLLIIIPYLIIQGTLAYVGFYKNFDAMPPRALLLLLPTLGFITSLFCTRRGKEFIDHLDMRWMTLLHIVRIPVELCLYWLFLAKTIPEIMTFDGQNFDILAGVTAPITYILFFIKKKISHNILLAWNILFTLVLLNIIITALLSAPLPFQQIAFEQPNMAIVYFPFNWLACFIAPAALFSHFVAIRRLMFTHHTDVY